MLRFIRRITRKRRDLAARRPSLPRLMLPGDPPFVYAIGDVHGCLDKLRALEASIVADAADNEGLKLIVMLGDYVDRGSDSAGVIEHLSGPPPEGFHRVCLRGNHDDLMLHVLRRPEDADRWLKMGGRATLLSYGFDLDHLTQRDRRATTDVMRAFAASVPPRHLQFLDNLPVAVSTTSYIFVHAGLRPPLSLDDQDDLDLLWIRDTFLDHEEAPFERTIVHGHTPLPRAVVSSYRVSVDTGACLGGALTAARLSGNGVRLISID